MKNLARLLLVLTLALASLAGSAAFVPVAHAQVPVVGTADFREAPQLPPGQYRDRLVTGDSAWYALVYTNNTPYRFEVAIDGARPSNVELAASFVAPTLTVVDGPAGVVENDGVAYPEPAGHTNVWFLKVTMDTSGQTGVEYPIIITVDGVQSLGVDDCSETPDCDLDVEYAAVNLALAEARTELEAIEPQNQLSAVRVEVEGLRSSAEGALATRPGIDSRPAQAEATMAQLCAPDVTCEEFPEPTPNTPLVGMVVGVAALAGGAYLAVKKLRKNDEEEEEEEEDGLHHRQVSRAG